MENQVNKKVSDEEFFAALTKHSDNQVENGGLLMDDYEEPNSDIKPQSKISKLTSYISENAVGLSLIGYIGLLLVVSLKFM